MQPRDGRLVTNIWLNFTQICVCNLDKYIAISEFRFDLGRFGSGDRARDGM